MLNRRILRIKAFKILFSYAENPSMTLAEAESQLEISCEATRSLYLFMLAVIPALAAEASVRIEDASRKFNPTAEELNPNRKFADNALARLLAEDPDFRKAVERNKLSWEPYDVFLHNLYDSVRSKEWYAAYMADPEPSLAADVKLFIRIFEAEFVDSEELARILEDLSIWWTDDLAYALTCCCDTLKDLARGKRWSLPPLYRSEMLKDKQLDSDKAFVFHLLRGSYAGFQRSVGLIAESVPQWEKDRLFTSDVVLIAMGLAEAKVFPDMPVRVTINEYVEISKFYSTPKSSSFVNGLLDKLIRRQIEEGSIVKTEKFD